MNKYTSLLTSVDTRFLFLSQGSFKYLLVKKLAIDITNVLNAFHYSFALSDMLSELGAY